jgi:4-hydroxy-tetrahydrodipicolinate synthase
MSITELEPRVRPESETAAGIWAPAVTPVDRDLQPDPERFAAHVRWLLASGCHGVAVFGTTGEANSFSVDERIALLDATLEAGIPPERLMVGTGCCALTDSVRLTRHAIHSGCARVLMLPPFYYKGVSDEALYASYAAVIDRVGNEALAVYLYHFPRLSGVAITTGLVERLLASPYAGAIQGIKDSSGDRESTLDFTARFPGLAVFPGTETLLLAGLEAGGAGCITASANVNAPAIRRVYDAWAAGSAEAAGLQAIIGAQRAALQSQAMIPTLKRLLARAHNDPAWLAVRPPMLATSESGAAEQDAALAAAGFAFGA